MDQAAHGKENRSARKPSKKSTRQMDSRWGEDRMYEMIEKRPDWLRLAPAILGRAHHRFLLRGLRESAWRIFKALRNVVKWFEEEGADAWYKYSSEKLLPNDTTCACGASKWRKENDILDVWFDSGTSNLSVLKAPMACGRYLEGPDQYRGWFQSSLLVATGVRDASPLSRRPHPRLDARRAGPADVQVAGQRDYPKEICDKWGADLLRLWVASVEYQADMKMSERVMTQLSEAYRKIRNTFRFALGNLGDFDPSRDSLPNDQLEEIDRWMLDRTAELVKKCREWYANYESTASITPSTITASWTQLFLFRRTERSSLHQSAQKQIAPLRTNRCLETL